MSGKSVTRRVFLRTSAAVAASGALAPRGLWALGQDAVVDVPRSNNHTGYEKVAWKARPFPMQQVRLNPGPLKDMQERNRVYLYMLPNDRLLHSFRLTAGKSSAAQPLGGWEAPDCDLRGHLTGGHYLSACALMYASTGDESLRVKAEEMVMALAECQQQNGYLGAYPSSMFERMKKGVELPADQHWNSYADHVWAPFYTYHKIMAGHLDMYLHCGSEVAFHTVERMADWAIRWIAPLSDAEMAHIQMIEYGGMNEVMFNLYAITGEKKYLDAGYRFEQKRFFNPLAAHEDKLAGLHSNTNIPKVIGAARGYELTGDERYKDIAEFFWQTVVDHHSFAPGGTSNTNEGWSEPDTAGSHLGPGGQECCCSYNMLKLTRHLFGWKPDARWMDYYEHLLWNVRVGTQNENGRLMYYVPTIPGGWKTFDSPYESNLCCTGSGMEEYAKLVDTIYFHDENSVYVNQFVASEVSWPEKRARMVQQTNFPQQESTSIVVYAQAPVAFVLKVRAPHWARAIAMSVNGRPERAVKGSDGYLAVERTWKNGDRIEVTLPMTLRQEAVAGSPELASLAFGPLVLAASMGRDGLSQEMIDAGQGPDMDRLPALPMPQFEARAETGKQAKEEVSWVKKTGQDELTFQTVGQVKEMGLKPLYQVMDERYSVYLQKARKA
jgi:DUF1680 family protein